MASVDDVTADNSYDNNNSSTAPLNMTSFPALDERYPGIALYERFTPEALWFGRVLFVVWLIVGLPGNALSATVWLERRMRNSSSIYIAALSINCCVFLVMHTVNALKFLWGIEIYHYPVVCELVNVFYMMPQYVNQLLILAFTVDRYIAVCFPLRRRIYCRPSRAVKVVLCMILGAAVVSSVQYYYRPYSQSERKCVNRPETAGMAAWKTFTEILFSLVGPLASLACNGLVIHGVRNARRARSLMTLKTPGTGNRLPVSGPAADGASPKPKQATGLATPAPALPSYGGNECDVTSSACCKAPTYGRPTTKTATKLANRKQLPGKTATTSMLLWISFFYVATTLPSTLLFMIYTQFPVGDNRLSDDEVEANPVWRSYFAFYQLELVVYELSMVHYVVNLFIFLPTGKYFRQAVVDFLSFRRSAETAAAVEAGGGKMMPLAGIETVRNE